MKYIHCEAGQTTIESPAQQLVKDEPSSAAQAVERQGGMCLVGLWVSDFVNAVLRVRLPQEEMKLCTWWCRELLYFGTAAKHAAQCAAALAL